MVAKTIAACFFKRIGMDKQQKFSACMEKK